MSLSGARATWANYTLDGITNTDVDFKRTSCCRRWMRCRNSRCSPESIPRSSAARPDRSTSPPSPAATNTTATAFEFLRNNALDARSYDFLSSTHRHQSLATSTPYRQNQYGFTLGGPVRIPKVFNGKNRLFFMSNFEGFKSPHHHDVASPPP